MPHLRDVSFKAVHAGAGDADSVADAKKQMTWLRADGDPEDVASREMGATRPGW